MYYNLIDNIDVIVGMRLIDMSFITTTGRAKSDNSRNAKYEIWSRNFVDCLRAAINFTFDIDFRNISPWKARVALNDARSTYNTYARALK
jgi:hypothetical protein